MIWHDMESDGCECDVVIRCDVFLVVDFCKCDTLNLPFLELPAAFAGERHDFQCFAHSRWQGVASSAKGH